MKIFPRRKPYRSGYLKVPDGHRLYYALYGNPRGTPVLYVHGGPGSGSKDKYRVFDPRLNILTLDQRGSGRSTPSGSLRCNTTQDLVTDIELFLDFLDIKKVILAGNSWGACLSLCFAISHPQRVRGMLLWAIFLGTSGEINYFLNGGARNHVPDVWTDYVHHVPRSQRSNPGSYYIRQILSKNNTTARKTCTYFQHYEHSLVDLQGMIARPRSQLVSAKDLSRARILMHYISQKCFLPPDYIMRNLDLLGRLPITLIHGRYDLLCPLETAYSLHRALPQSRFIVTKSGHSTSTTEVLPLILKEMKRWP